MRYQYLWATCTDDSGFPDLKDIQALADRGWRVVTVVSRPGVAERALMELVLEAEPTTVTTTVLKTRAKKGPKS